MLAVEHLPALDTKHFSIGLLLDEVKPVDECVPFCWISFNHGFLVGLCKCLMNMDVRVSFFSLLNINNSTQDSNQEIIIYAGIFVIK